MTIFILVCIAIFTFSLMSNIFFTLTSEDSYKIGGVIGIIVFTAMIAWSCALIF